MDFQLPTDLAPELKSVFEKPEVAAVLTTLINSAKAPLLTNRDEVLGQLATVKTKLKTFEDEAAKAKADAETARLTAAEKDGNIETVKKHYGEQLAAVQAELATVRQAELNEKVSAKVTKAISDADGVPDLLEHHVRNRVKGETVDGKVKLTVLNAAGAPMLTADGKEASMKDLLAEFKANPTFQPAFKAPAANGGGSRQSEGLDGSNPWAPATKNVTNQMKLYRADKATAIRLAAQHGVTLT